MSRAQRNISRSFYLHLALRCLLSVPCSAKHLPQFYFHLALRCLLSVPCSAKHLPQFLLTFSFEVPIECPVLCETSPAVFTLVGLLSSMDSFMTYHGTLLTETTVTKVTNIR